MAGFSTDDILQYIFVFPFEFHWSLIIKFQMTMSRWLAHPDVYQILSKYILNPSMQLKHVSQGLCVIMS